AGVVGSANAALTVIVPSITCPSSVTVQCASAIPAAATDSASFIAQGGTITGDCTPFTISSIDTTTPGSCPNRFTVTRAYTLTDACGNTATCNQTITVND